MKIYNSLTKKIEQFEPIATNNIRIYSCGPTVYNNLHIGNLAAFIYADLLRRAIVSCGYQVTAVMNITDVDDKTIRDSKKEYPEHDPMEALKLLTHRYEEIFIDDLSRIGNDETSLTFIRATETIQEMIQITQGLLDAGLAYLAEDAIYFSIKNYELAGYKYGQLQEIDRSHERARIVNDEYDKNSASDFALWKHTTKDEPSWEASYKINDESIVIPGRPGWHIECSAMSQKLLGIPFDIHTGGIDLKFPHHENEIAQSCGVSGSKVFANYFVHNNHILVDGKKMSKSLNNFFTLRDIEQKNFSPMAFRLLVLSSHYRNESNFSWEILESAQRRLNHWQAVADTRWQYEKSSLNWDEDISITLQDDLNTPVAVSQIDKYFDYLESSNMAPSQVDLRKISDLLGIDLHLPDINEETKGIIKKRELARKNKDWTESDNLRQQLEQMGIAIKDTQNGPVWSRI
jgi:cysteinyl-tRNA synthetase